MVAPPPELLLATRLRELRNHQWPHLKVTQSDVAVAFGVSPQQVSSWESTRRAPQTPSDDRLAAYALFFCTSRSMTERPARLLDVTELTPAENAVRQRLETELQGMRSQITTIGLRTQSTGPAVGRFWQFGDGTPIVIIGSQQSDTVLKAIPEANERHPDYVRALHHADADAVIELYGHLRAENPRSPVGIMLPDEVVNSVHLNRHVAILGGQQVNRYARWFAREGEVQVDTRMPTLPMGLDPETWTERRFRVPAELLGDDRAQEIELDGEGRRLAVFRAEFRGTVEDPRLGDSAGHESMDTVPSLYRDVALVARQPNPLAPDATATLIHGLFSRGTFGAVRALTDPEMLEKNEAYLAERFEGRSRFWMLISVLCDRTLPITQTPDLRDTVILDWSEE